MKTLPEHLQPYKQTPVFTEETVPPGLLRSHTTKAGSWATIIVAKGQIRYRILEPAIEEHLLTPARPGIVEPRVPHELVLLGPVEFYVEFHREAGETTTGDGPSGPSYP